jgi:hypothetical protein
MKKQNAYEIAGFTVGVDTDISNHLHPSTNFPEATCFVVESPDFILQKLFHSYAAFTPKNIDHVRKMLALVVHLESDATLMHAAYTKTKFGNVLLVGKSQAGKSTLAGIIGDTIDDDVVVYREGILYVPSIHGYKAMGRSPNKQISIATENVSPSKPNHCFILDKTRPGGFILETDNLHRQHYMPDYFSRENLNQYDERNTFRKPNWLPIHIVGTNGEIARTVEAIFKVLTS